MKEFELIHELSARSRPLEGLRRGIGDDAAVLEPGRFDLVTVDTMVEGVHFRLDYSTAWDVGWKLMATNLSDVAAMGGAPGPFFLAMSLGERFGRAEVDALLEGIEAAVKELVPAGFDTGLAGGDTTRSPGRTVLSLTLMGESPPTGAILRSGARPGDRVVLIGELGLAAAGLALLSSELPEEGLPDGAEALREAHRRPRAQVLAGALLGLHGLASALIDVSDGCARDLGHLLAGSRVGARLYTEHIPVRASLRRLAALMERSVWSWVLSGGDDYALLATVSPDRMGQLRQVAQEYGFEVADIGEVRTEAEGLTLFDVSGRPMELESVGYEHQLGPQE